MGGLYPTSASSPLRPDFSVVKDHYRTARPDYVPGVRATSKAAYRDIKPTLGRQHEAILGYIIAQTKRFHTRAELAKALGFPTSTMAGRVNELVQAGKLREGAERHICGVSGRKVRVVAVA